MSTGSTWIAGRRLSRKARRRVQMRRLGGFEQLEERRVLAAWISELHVNPLFGSSTTDQYVELRGPANGSIDAGTYLVVVDGDDSERGEIHTVFNLSGLPFGSNGYLVLLEQGNGYETSSAANVVTSTAESFGGLPGNRFSDDSTLTDTIDFIFGANTFLLLQSSTPPTVADDIDSNDDGVADGVFSNWNVLDSVAVLGFAGTAAGSASYAATTFSIDGVGTVPAGGTMIAMQHNVSYVARIGESTGSSATDWVGGTTTAREGDDWKFRLERGIFGTPEPQVYSGRDLDHIGSPNFFASIRGTVFDDADGDGIQDSGEAGRAGVVVTADQDGDPATTEYVVHVEPDDFPLQSDMTNVIPNATLTTTDSDNEISSFFVRPQAGDASTGDYVFAHEGVAFTPNTRKIRIEFYDPVRSVSIDTTGGGGTTYGRLEAFDRSGQSQGFVRTSELSRGQVQRITITHAQPDIAYAIAWSDSDFMNSFPFGVFDNLSFVQHEYTTTTDSNGHYEFNLLPPGTYQVSYDTAGSQIATTPTSQAVALAGTEAASSVNFGNKQNSPPNIADQTLHVNENATNGTQVGTVVATDADPGQTISYSIIGGTGASAFSIHPTTGLVKVANSAALDFESAAALTLTVQARDNYGTPLSSSATVTIELNDANEAPVITSTAFSVDENAGAGTSVGTVVATDVDGDGIRYSIADGNTGSAFAIDESTGEITVASSIPLDAETHTHIDLSVRATDDGSPERFSAQTVRITIRNVNEALSIPDQSFQINENSPLDATVGTLAIDDPDAGESFQFTVTGGTGQNVFAIHPTGGVIRVKEASLDFEATNSFTLEFDVLDGGTPPLHTSGAVTIAVSNQNDPPVVAPQTFSVDENSGSGAAVGTVVANDQDVGQNLSFAIAGGGGQGILAIDAATGLISVADGSALNFEQAASLTLVVEVSDNGAPSQTTTATMTIELNNGNDAPTIADQQLSLAENASVGATVGTVDAADEDAGDSIAYEIVGGTGESIFAIDADSGVITVVQAEPLDLEADAAFTLHVKVTDRANASSQGTVTIALTDVNEFDPSVVEQTFSIDENSPPGTPVGIVDATDADQGEVLTFEITAGNSNDAFSIEAETGQLRVQSPPALDHETNATYTLTVRVTDNVAPLRSNSATVTIQLGNVNEFAPAIGDAAFEVSEDASAGTEVGTVTATDADSSPSLAYSITGGNDANSFEIDSATGVIRVAPAAQLDHEANAAIQLTVMATDNGQPARSSTSTITIHVSDENEFAPSLDAQVFSIDENSPNGASVGLASGTDLDSSQELSYEIISGNSQNAFQIDAASGEIRVHNSLALDHEFLSEVTLTIRVTDDGSPVKTRTGTVTINVNDVNEATPRLELTSLIAPEGSPAGTSVGVVSAADADSRQTLTYAITSGNIGDAFAINATTGDVTVQTPEALNFESLRGYELTIEVIDSGTPPRSDSFIYVVEVTDVNEFDPVVPETTLHIAEDSSPGTSAGVVSVTDGDTQQSHVFAITAGNTGDALVIDSVTGVIALADGKSLDHGTMPMFVLSVLVTDSGNPPRSVTASVNVLVDDVNAAPTASINGPFTIDTGRPLILDATGSGDVDANDELTYHWDLDDDGVADVTSGNPVTAVPWSTITALGLGVGSHPIRLTVSDKAHETDTASSSLTISDSLSFVAPEDGTAQAIQFGIVEGMFVVDNGVGTGASAAPDDVARVTIQGSSQNDTLTIDYMTGNPIPPAGIAFDGGAGVDTFVIGGSDVNLDLTGNPSTRFTNIEAINIIGQSPNTLTVDADAVLGITDEPHTLTVISDGDDTVDLGGGWTLTGTGIEDGRFIRILVQGSATIHLNGPNDWHHPLNRLDVSNNGSVEPLDVLLIINELNVLNYTTADRHLIAAVGLSEFPGFFFDVSNDAFLSPLDALIIINFANSGGAGEGESSAVAGDTASPLFAMPAFVTDGSPIGSVAESPRAVRESQAVSIPSTVPVARVSEAATLATSRSPLPSRRAVQAIDDLFAELDATELSDLLKS